MFKEIESELLSILSEDSIEKIAHMPSKEIAKTMDLIYDIKFDDIQRVYTENMYGFRRMTVIYDAKNKNKISCDCCPIGGNVYHITFVPSNLITTSESNAIELSRFIIKYISIRVNLILSKYDNIIDKMDNTTLELTTLQAIPIITCAVMRKIYSGASLSKVIFMSLTETLSTYKKLYTERGIETILELLSELTVYDLLDNGFICSIKPNDTKYPGIWLGLYREIEG